ncbi:MAG: hypothetical protein NTW66_02995 [Candidatus Magasanikbacteria bacterium]|nr:hypothetical protein [Candidatus Magasanikbacteria bacterium]
MSEKQLLAGTRAYRRIHPEEKDQRAAMLRRQRSANATTDVPDVEELMNIYGADLVEAIGEYDWKDLFAKCATPIGRDEITFWLAQCSCPEARRTLSAMFYDGAVDLYCLVGAKRCLCVETHHPQLSMWDCKIYPSDTALDYMADDVDEVADSKRTCDFAGDSDVLSVIFAEWVFGRPKSTAARSFICSVCERAEGPQI